MCLSSLFKELWPFENSKMYRNVLKIHFLNGQNSLENVSISLKLGWQMLLWILWNSLKIWIWAQNLNWKKFWTEKNFEQKKIFEKKFFLGPNMYQPKSGVKKFCPLVGGGGGGGSPKKKSCSKWAETHFGFGIFEIRSFSGGGGGVQKVNGATSKAADLHPDTIVTR